MTTFDPLHYESMTCINSCGYMLIWHRSSTDDPGMMMNEHLEKECVNSVKRYLNQFRKGKK